MKIKDCLNLAPRVAPTWPTWPQLGLNLASTWPELGPPCPTWAHLGPNLAQLGPTWFQLSQTWPVSYTHLTLPTKA